MVPVVLVLHTEADKDFNQEDIVKVGIVQEVAFVQEGIIQVASEEGTILEVQVNILKAEGISTNKV